MSIEDYKKARDILARQGELEHYKERINAQFNSRIPEPEFHGSSDNLFATAVKRFLMECDEILEREIEKLEQQLNEL